MTYGLLYRCLTITAFQRKCFVFLCGHQDPPATKMPRGYLSRKKVYIFLKFKIIKTQVFDVETEGICVMVHNKHY